VAAGFGRAVPPFPGSTVRSAVVTARSLVPYHAAGPQSHPSDSPPWSVAFIRPGVPGIRFLEPGIHFRRPAQQALKNDDPRAFRHARLAGFLSAESAALCATIDAVVAMAPQRPPQLLAEDQRYNADFVLRFMQREAARRVAKRPEALTAAQRAALRN
jgi:hypothetical protein